MTKSSAKVYLAGIGILSLGFFFWVFLYQIFTTTNASANGIHAFFETERMQVASGSHVNINLYLRSKLDEKISGATIVLQYPPNLLSFVGTLNETNYDPSNPTFKTCMDNKYRLTKVLKVNDDHARGLLTITRVALEHDDNLPSGIMCFGTISFIADPAAKPGTDGYVGFATTAAWDFVGPDGTYRLLDEGRNTVRIQVTGNAKGKGAQK